MFRLNCRLPPIWEKQTSLLPELFPHGLSFLTFLLSSTQFPTSTFVEYFFSICQPGVESAWGTAAVTNMVRILPASFDSAKSGDREVWGGGVIWVFLSSFAFPEWVAGGPLSSSGNLKQSLESSLWRMMWSWILFVDCLHGDRHWLQTPFTRQQLILEERSWPHMKKPDWKGPTMKTVVKDQVSLVTSGTPPLLDSLMSVSWILILPSADMWARAKTLRYSSHYCTVSEPGKGLENKRTHRRQGSFVRR